MNIKSHFFGLLFLLGGFAGFGQSVYQAGLLPSINVNKKLKNDWSLNFKIESRQLLEEGELGDDNPFEYEYLLTDLAWVASKKIQVNQTLAAGYLIRLRDQKPTHRFIQQYTITKNYSNFRMSHRFVADQTFDEGESMELRLRYRISTLFPLRGQEIDPKEFYLKVNHEYLNAFQDNAYDLEMRLIPLMGYMFSKNNKFEFGLDYRLSSFLERNTDNRFWLSLNWYIAF